MESTFILENFLLSRSSLASVITAEQFGKELPPDIPVEAGERIYEELAKQRQEGIIEPVKLRIKKEFDIPVGISEDSAAEGDSLPTKKYSLAELVEDLNHLEKQLDGSNTSIDREISDELSSIRNIIDELNDLKYGKSWFRGGTSSDVDDVVDEAIKSIEKCEKFLDK